MKRLAISLFLLISVPAFAQPLAPPEVLAERTAEKAPERSSEQQLELFKKSLGFFDKDNFEKASEGFAQLENSDLLPEYVNYFQAQMALKKNDLALARTKFLKIIDMNPTAKLRSDVQFELARMSNDQGRFMEAKKWLTPLEKSQRFEKTYADILYQLTRAEVGIKSKVGACKWLKKLFVSHPMYEPIQNWDLSLADNLFEGKPTGCSTQPDDLKKRIRTLQFVGNSEEALKEIRELQKVAGDKYEVDRLEVLYLLAEGEIPTALAKLMPYYESKKNDFNFLMLFASTSARAGEFPAAVGSYYRAYKVSPKGKLGREALYQSAFLSYQFQDYDGASRKFKEFVRVFPTSGLAKDARWHMAWVRYLRQDYTGAFTAFSELRKVRKSSKIISQERVTYWMAMSLYRQGKLAQAKQLFEVLAADPLYGYYALAANNRLAKLGVELAKVVDEAPKQKRKIARFVQGETLIPYDDVIAASEDGEESLNLNPLQPVIAEEEAMAEALANPEDLSADANAVAISEPTSEESNLSPSFSNPVLVKRFERARDLMVVGMNDWARWELYEIEKKTSNREYLRTLIGEYQNVESYFRSSTLGQMTFARQRAQYGIDGIRYLWEAAYPKAYEPSVMKYSKSFDIPSELIWSIMRAESQYRPGVVSPVGALGLMQVMPHTGSRLATMMGDKSFHPQQLLQPEGAVRLGGRYLQRLMKKFDGNIALVAASYNAGPHRVKGWVANFGKLDLDEFIDHIPFLETRNYVKRVMANFSIYDRLYAKDSKGKDGRRKTISELADPLTFKFTDPVPTKETWEDI